MSHTPAGVRNETVSWAPSRTTRRVIAVLAFAVATAIGARISVPVPFSMVPITLQTLVVLLAGALLGPGLGAASQLAYLAAGVAGLPVFTGGAGAVYLLGPTGGYLLAFPVAAFLAGVVSGRVQAQGFSGLVTLFVGLFLVSLVILGGGTAWLGAITGDMGTAVATGLLPFLLGDVIKVALTALIAWRIRHRTLGSL